MNTRYDVNIDRVTTARNEIPSESRSRMVECSFRNCPEDGVRAAVDEIIAVVADHARVPKGSLKATIFKTEEV